MARGLSREDAARFAFLLATPVILAAGRAEGARPGSARSATGSAARSCSAALLSGVGAYLSVRFLLRYLRTRTLTPFGIYCVIAGVACLAYLGLK